MRQVAIALLLMATFTGCRQQPDYPVYLCPRCGPTEGHGSKYFWHSALEAGHRLPAPSDDSTGPIEVCSNCGEILDRISSDKNEDFLAPMEVICPETNRTIQVRRDPDYPWDYMCPSCGKTVLRRPEGAK